MRDRAYIPVLAAYALSGMFMSARVRPPSNPLTDEDRQMIAESEARQEERRLERESERQARIAESNAAYKRLLDAQILIDTPIIEAAAARRARKAAKRLKHR